LRNTYRYIGNNTNKRSSIKQAGRYARATGEETTEASSLEYLKLSYPSTKEGVWNTEEAVQDLKKYGA
jgi:hypothetical protein